VGDEHSGAPDPDRSAETSRERYLLGAISRHSLVGLAVVEEGRVTYANDGVDKIFGLSREELYALEPGGFARVLHPEDREMALSYFTKRMAKDPDVPEQYDIRVVAPDGSVKWIAARAERVEIGGRPVLVASVVDITERKLAEEALRNSEARYRNLFDHAPIGIAMVSMDEKVLAVNDAVVKMTTRPRERLIGTNLAHLEALFPDAVRPVRRAFERVRNGEVMEPVQVEVSANREQSAWMEVLVTLPEEEGASRYFHVIVRNITEMKTAEREKRDLEMQLRHQQKLEAIGTLAAGVAHEINNPITGILNYAQIIAKRAGERDEARDHAESIMSESWRVSEIVKSLLAFSRQEKTIRGPCRLGEIVEVTLKLVRTLLKKDQIEVEVDIPDDLPLVSCSNQQIQQVLMNIITNARDALVERHPGEHGNNKITITGLAVRKNGAGWARITVLDRGVGIPSDIADRIFEPFFTTKPFDTGTGLGLSVSYGIVREHGGELWFESDAENGTRFHLDLPADVT
jgi:PAS domain S-box-containing protein